jgi:hypothetical protein
MSQFTKLMCALAYLGTVLALFMLGLGFGLPLVYNAAGCLAAGGACGMWVVVVAAIRDDRARHEPPAIPAPREPETDREQPVTRHVRPTDQPVKHHRAE